MRRTSTASGTSPEDAICVILRRASSDERRAPVQPEKEKTAMSSTKSDFFIESSSLTRCVMIQNTRLADPSLARPICMRVKCLFFASLKDIVGARQLELDL